MYAHRMIRTQLYLDEEIHSRLRGLAERQGRTVSELVRDALVRVCGSPDRGMRRSTLRAIEGLWRDRKDLGRTDEYVRRLRRDTRRVKGRT
jgi:hypothetical protein